MNRFISAIKAVGMARWFFVNSWSFVITNKIDSKIEFFKFIIPAWYRFTISIYKDCRRE